MDFFFCSESVRALFINTGRDQKLWTRNMKGFRFLGVGGNRSAGRKPTKAGMELANLIHIQPLATIERKRKEKYMEGWRKRHHRDPT